MLTVDAIELFLVDRRAANCRPRTERFYRDQLRKLAGAYPELPTRAHDIRLLLAGQPGQPETRHALYRAIRALYTWLETVEELIEPNDNPCHKLRAPKVPKKVQRSLDAVDVGPVLGAAGSPRDRLVLHLLLDCGIRAGEVQALRGRDVCDGYLRITGKGGNMREVPVSAAVLDQLRVERAGQDEPLFRNIFGEPLGTRSIYKIVRRALESVGLAVGKSGPHMLRHSFARHFLDQGGELTTLQRLLGHADISTTARYVNMSFQEVQKEFKEHSLLVANATLRRVV